AHRQTTRNDDVAMLLKPVVRLLDAGVPFAPRRAAELLRRSAVAGELAAINGVAGSSEAMGHEPHFGRRAAQSLNQQYAHTPAANEVAAIRQPLLGHFVVPTRHFSLHAVDP